MLRKGKFIAALLLFAGACFAGQLVICTETDSGATAGDSANGLQQGGCVQSLPTSSPPILLASDGEVSFEPFEAGVDTSDGIQFPASSGWVMGAGVIGWVQLLGANGGPIPTWVLPANLSGIGCGVENSTTCEPAGMWYWPGASWPEGTPSDLVMLDSDGVTISDEVFVNNNGPGGSAEVIFQSAPDIPEPGTLTMLGVGLLLMAGPIRRRVAR